MTEKAKRKLIPIKHPYRIFRNHSKSDSSISDITSGGARAVGIIVLGRNSRDEWKTMEAHPRICARANNNLQHNGDDIVDKLILHPESMTILVGKFATAVHSCIGFVELLNGSLFIICFGNCLYNVQQRNNIKIQ